MTAGAEWRRWVPLIALALAGCVTSGAGTTPIRISNSLEQAYLKYRSQPSAGQFWVAEDGSYATWDQCPDGSCRPGGYNLVGMCESKSGKRCGLFAEGGKIVWTGPVTFASGRTY